MRPRPTGLIGRGGIRSCYGLVAPQTPPSHSLCYPPSPVTLRSYLLFSRVLFPSLEEINMVKLRSFRAPLWAKFRLIELGGGCGRPHNRHLAEILAVTPPGHTTQILPLTCCLRLSLSLVRISCVSDSLGAVCVGSALAQCGSPLGRPDKNAGTTCLWPRGEAAL